MKSVCVRQTETKTKEKEEKEKKTFKPPPLIFLFIVLVLFFSLFFLFLWLHDHFLAHTCTGSIGLCGRGAITSPLTVGFVNLSHFLFSEPKKKTEDGREQTPDKCMCRVPSGVSLLYIYTDCDCVLCVVFFVSVRVIDCRWHLREKRKRKKKNRIFPIHRSFFIFFFWQFSLFHLFIILENFNFLLFILLLYFSCVRSISGTDKPKRRVFFFFF